MNNTLTIIIGLPRSGKSTWIEENKGDAIVISNDWIRENILGISYSKSANAVVWAIVDSALRIILGQGKDVILDGTNHTFAVRKFFVDIAREYGAKIKMVCVTTPFEICLLRNGKKETAKLPNDVLFEMSSQMEFPYEDENEYDEVIYVRDSFTEEESNKLPF